MFNAFLLPAVNAIINVAWSKILKSVVILQYRRAMFPLKYSFEWLSSLCHSGDTKCGQAPGRKL